jgi:flagellar basal-body rod protein FlgF
MPDGLTIAYSGAIAQSEALDAAASNLANASTAGFRAQRPVFAEVLAGSGGPGGAEGRGVRLSRLELDLSQGPVQETGNALDVALRGPGFLVVSTPAGERYTRTGNLAVSRAGTLVTAAGQIVQGEGGQPIRLGAGAASIGADGSVQQGGATVGRLRLVEFADPKQLLPEGEALLRAPDDGSRDAAPRPAAATDVLGGHLERSNVNVVRGLTDLVRISRAYEAFHRAIQTLRDIDQRAANDVAARK